MPTAAANKITHSPMAMRVAFLARSFSHQVAGWRPCNRNVVTPAKFTHIRFARNNDNAPMLTGNGLSVSEDLARRFLAIELDARTEDPEARAFRGDIRADVKARRTELLAACLTIWRWGRQTADLKPGRPLGSFNTWCAWVRDPLLALGCADPAERVAEAKQRDGRRQAIADLFVAWWQHHAGAVITGKELHDDVRLIADPQGRGRQFLASFLDRQTNARAAGFVLTRQSPPGKWGTATYSLQDVGGAAALAGQHSGTASPAPAATWEDVL